MLCSPLLWPCHLLPQTQTQCLKTTYILKKKGRTSHGAKEEAARGRILSPLRPHQQGKKTKSLLLGCLHVNLCLGHLDHFAVSPRFTTPAGTTMWHIRGSPVEWCREASLPKLLPKRPSLPGAFFSDMGSEEWRWNLPKFVRGQGKGVKSSEITKEKWHKTGSWDNSRTLTQASYMLNKYTNEPHPQNFGALYSKHNTYLKVKKENTYIFIS